MATRTVMNARISTTIHMTGDSGEPLGALVVESYSDDVWIEGVEGRICIPMDAVNEVCKQIRWARATAGGE